MSQTFFNLTDGRLYGFLTYHADPAWELSSVEKDERFIYFPCQNDEGYGCWSVFDRKNYLWGSIYRRSDAPYNDCLPPSESLLLDSFKQSNNRSEIIDFARNEAENDFYNPFNLIVCDVSKCKIDVLKQSFQPKVNHYEGEGIYTIQDDGELSEQDSPGPLPKTNEDFITNMQEIEFSSEPFSVDDGMRTLRKVLLFDWTPKEFEIQLKSFDTESGDWATISTEQGAPH